MCVCVKKVALYTPFKPLCDFSLFVSCRGLESYFVLDSLYTSELAVVSHTHTPNCTHPKPQTGVLVAVWHPAMWLSMKPFYVRNKELLIHLLNLWNCINFFVVLCSWCVFASLLFFFFCPVILMSASLRTCLLGVLLINASECLLTYLLPWVFVIVLIC